MRLLVSLRLSGMDAEERSKACRAAFTEASGNGIDEIRLQPAFMEQPPAALAAAIKSLRVKAHRWRRLSVPSPSQSAIETSLEACPYLESVVFLHQGHMVMGAGDAADTVDFATTSDRWPPLRQQLVDLLGSKRIQIEELGDE